MNEFDNEEQSMCTMRGDTKEGTLGRIDQYDIISKLGGGGFGVVYLVRDTQSDVEYAIKTLHPLLKSNLEEMENLRSQFKLVSKLIHSHIAPAMILHSVKEVVYSSEDVRKELLLSPGDFVMVMKYAPGVILSQWRKQFSNAQVPVDYAIGICSHVAAALDYAHSEKIIHRDIKPSNVMVETREDGTTIARVLDFGLAAEIRSSMSRVSTEKGDTSGTRPYMAPEQWQGKKQGPATDQYALACMFYELVSGAVPFAGAFETGDFNLMMYSVENRSPEPLDELSEEQNAALQRALSKNPNDRFASCVEFISALQGYEVLQVKQELPKHTSTKTVVCKKCGSENNKISLYCDNCGNKIERDDICLNCGAETGPSQKFCNKCGAKTRLYIAEEKAEAERIARTEAEHKAQAEAEQKARKEAESITFEKAKSVLEKWNMVLIPDSAKHKGLYFGKYQVTQAQWQAIMDNNPSKFTGELFRPVERVSWYDCQEFIKKLHALPEVKQAGLTFSLPTEEQWEYACRAGSTGDYGLLADGREGTLDEMGWYRDNSGDETHSVGQKKPNAWGLYDMHGNVWEWTASVNGSYSIGRGGSYYSDTSGCKADGLGSGYPDRRCPNLGFRLVAINKVEAERIAASEEAECKAREKAGTESIIKDMVQIPNSSEHKGLYFGKYQVTQAQWQSIMGNNPSYFTGDSFRPVEQVSWNDCQEFIKKLNAHTEVKSAGITFRLPTEEEWEYACRAGSKGKYGLLADGREGKRKEMGWYEDNSGGETHPVGQKKPNAWGLYDMHGNVWEWTASAFGSSRIYRGGGYYTTASGCGSGRRYWSLPEDRDDGLGFRLAASRTDY